MQNLNQYLDNWHDFYYENNNFDPKIEILVQDYVMNKNKNDFEILMKKIIYKIIMLVYVFVILKNLI